MQSSYNVIKKHCVNARNIYTINAPFTPEGTALPETEAEEPQESPSSEELRAYAESIVNDASEKAQTMLDSARQEADRIKKDAYDMAFKRGYNEGLKKGTEDGLHRVEGIRKEAEDVLKEAHRVSREYISRQKGEIVNLALDIAAKIIGCQVDLNDDSVTRIVTNSIENAVMRGQVTIKVNPMDYPFIDNMKDELSKYAGEKCIINIIRDSAIKRGGCRLDTDISSVDATIDTQLEKIKEALLG
jgi:flagellar assembly protein FliH